MESSSCIYKDPNSPIEARVKDLLSRMTLKEKVAQMTQIERSVASPHYLQDLGIGSVMNVGGSSPFPNAKSSDWADMVDWFQKLALQSRLGIPIIYGIDAVHGNNGVYGTTIFPHNVGLGATRDADLVRRIGVATALEVRACGIQYTFAPCVAVCRDPRWGRCYESYSEDTNTVREMASIVTGLQGQPPEGHPNGYPFLAGRSFLLKDKLGFKGFVISDWEALDRLSKPLGSNYRLCVSTAVNAGTDMVMVGQKHREFVKDLIFLAESGEIPMTRIDDAVERILRVKFVAGLFEHPFADRSLLDIVGSKVLKSCER
ncbi:hypothetical protein OIU77_028329 [Salix suchowensis]|uniref:Glycoside hydrolase family 3 N-terminal domain-containing protein n=1 Tax=Salix suchowensis TaxID=1278906 RepID=A0ABQ9BJR0_9ROSI|nr:hypothetical protein OIU77_028329 [Salix suchowensis]